MKLGTHPRPEDPARRQADLRILVVRIGAMGDVLHGLPAVAALRQARPGCTIGWAIEPHWAPLLRSAAGDMPLVDRVHLVNTRKWRERLLALETAGAIAALARELKAMDYDVCVDLQGSTKSAVVGRMASAKEFFGPEHPREWAAGILYDARVSAGAQHVTQQACELMGEAVGLPLRPAAVLLPVDADADGWCSGLLVRLGISTPFVLIAPAAGWGAKEWGANRFGEVARALKLAGYAVLVNSSGQDIVAADAAGVDNAPAVASTLPQLIALTRRAALVVGGDTGPVHLAAALGRPTLALFGPTDPARNGPCFPGATVQVLRHPASVTTYKRSARTEAGLARLGVEQVVATALAMLERGTRG